MGAHSWLITLPEHDSSPGSICCCKLRSPTPQSQLPVLQHWQKLCYDANADAHASFILVIKLFEPAREEIMTTVRSARLQGCGCLAWALWWVIEKRAWKQLEEDWGPWFVHFTIPISRIFWVASLCYLIHSNNIHGCTGVACTPWKQGIIAVFYWFLVDIKWETLFLHSLPRLEKTFCLHFLLGVKIRCALGSPEMKVH
jgi:hypothetical protein